MFKRFLRKLGRFLRALFNIGIPLKFVVLLLVIAIIACFSMSYQNALGAIGGKKHFDEASRYVTIKDLIAEKYIDEYADFDMANDAAAAIVAGLGDKWSYFMTPEEYQTYQLYSSAEFSAIGMNILKDEKSGGFVVMNVQAGSPVQRAGLGVGMVITSVDGEDITAKTADDVRTMIRSKLNTKFSLGVGKDTLTVDCSNTHQTTVKYRLEKTLAGYIQMADFEAGSAEAAIAAMENLIRQGAESIVFDLRNNAGGLYTECEQLLDYLMPAGDLFYEYSRDGVQKTYRSDSMCVEMRTVVLVNSRTYNAAEMFSQILKENGRATILGETTPGSTRSQETIVLSDGSAIRLSTIKYITSQQTDISASGGVIPDYIVYNSDESTVGTTQGTTGASTGTSSDIADEQLREALRMLSIR